MLRPFQHLRNFQGVRRNSVLANLAEDIKSGKSVRRNDVEKALLNRSFTPTEIHHLHDILRSDVSNDVANEVLYHGIPHDFSLYFTAVKKDQDFTWNTRTLEPLIKHNPGRVFSLVDLLEKHSAKSVSDAVRLSVVDKLLLGENNEAIEGEFLPSENNILKAIRLLNEVSNITVSENSLKLLVDLLAHKKALSAFALLKIDGLYDWLNSSVLPNEKTPEVFLPLSQLIFTHDASLLNMEALSKVLLFAGALKEDRLYSVQGFPLSRQPSTMKAYLESVLTYVEEHKLDLDKKESEALLLRLQLIETYGIDQDDMDLALRKFHDYQTHEKFGADLVQAKVVKASCYHAFKTQNKTFMKIAEALVNSERLAVATVAQTILSTSCFSSEKSLEIYNNYINRVSKTVNDATGRSATGVLTEALMVASLYDNDREFAQLLYEKAIANGIVNDEHEVASMKKVFKVYADAFVEDDWKVAQPIFGQYVLECIKKS